MPGKKRGGNGDGTVADITVEILRGIREELRMLREDTNARFATLERATVEGFAKLESRFDHLLDFAGERYRDHEERIRILERARDKQAPR